MFAGFIVGAGALWAWQHFQGGDTWTLYRSSMVPDKSRIHVATFDSQGGASYNADTCELLRGLAQVDNARYPEHLTYWCEEGAVRDDD